MYDALTKKGYAVTIVQNPTASLADDVAFTKRAISAQDGSVILVGHVIDYRVDGDRRSLGAVNGPCTIASEAGTYPSITCGIAKHAH